MIISGNLWGIQINGQISAVQGLHPNFSHILLLKNANPAMNTIIAKKRVKRIVNILGFNNSFIKSYYTISRKESVPSVHLPGGVTLFTPWVLLGIIPLSQIPKPL